MFQRHQRLHRSRIFSRPRPLRLTTLSIEDLNRDLKSLRLRGQGTMIEGHTTDAPIHICEITIIETAGTIRAIPATVVTIDQIRNSIATTVRDKVRERLTGQSRRERCRLDQTSKF